MTTETNEEKSGAEYLAQLLKDKKQIQAFPNVFIHLERILDDGKGVTVVVVNWFYPTLSALGTAAVLFMISLTVTVTNLIFFLYLTY